MEGQTEEKPKQTQKMQTGTKNSRGGRGGKEGGKGKTNSSSDERRYTSGFSCVQLIPKLTVVIFSSVQQNPSF